MGEGGEHASTVWASLCVSFLQEVAWPRATAALPGARLEARACVLLNHKPLLRWYTVCSLALCEHRKKSKIERGSVSPAGRKSVKPVEEGWIERKRPKSMLLLTGGARETESGRCHEAGWAILSPPAPLRGLWLVARAVEKTNHCVFVGWAARTCLVLSSPFSCL